MIKRYVTPQDDIQAILNDYPLNEMIELHLSEGIYHQKLHLAHPHLKLIGHDSKTTKITYNDYSYKMHQDGLLYNTFRTSTVVVTGDDVTLKNLTIENTSGHGLTIGQAVALSLYGDHSKIIDCHLKSYQDTLFLGPLPIDLTKRYDDFLDKSFLHTKSLFHYIVHTKIEGDIDFVFGSGMAYFDQCQFIALDKGYIFAPSTYQTYPYGFIVNDSIIETHHDEVIIARPWRSFGKVTLLNTTFNGKIHPNRYNTWDKSDFIFKEFPYVASPHSSSLNKEEIEQLKRFIKENLKNCSI